MKIFLCQINTMIGDFAGNQAKVLAGLKKAKSQGAALAVFPELTTTGYPPRDLLDNQEFIRKNWDAATAIAKATQNGVAAVFGFVDAPKGKAGRGLCNAAAFAADGKIQFVQHKTLLPTYDVFDEGRHFDPATTHHTVSYCGTTFGLSICEDIWSAFDFQGRQFYQTDPIALLKNKGAKVILNISASPFSLGQTEVRRKLIASAAQKNKVPVVYCNLVGGNDELVFDGQSLVADANGKIVFEGKRFEEDFALIDLDHPPKPIAPATPAPVDDIHQTLLLGLKDYVRKCGFKKVLIGLSGGIDSAVVAALAAEALGPKNVTGLAMPSPYSSKASLADAKALAKNLKIDLKIIPIETVYQSYRSLLGRTPKSKVGVSDENIQARIRGNLLMNFSNKTGALVLSTGNKSEMACGYCTLYGDLAGGLALISDVPKTSIYELAHFLNRDRKKIPKNIFIKPPSAELKPNQTDQDTLPPYEILDPILKAVIEEDKSSDEIVALGFKRAVVEDVLRRVHRNEYKRRQAPLGIKVTSKAFGSGRRFPVAWKYK